MAQVRSSEVFFNQLTFLMCSQGKNHWSKLCIIYLFPELGT